MRPSVSSDCRETIQGRKTVAIDVDLKHRALASTAALVRCPVQRIARQNQTRLRINSVAVRTARGCREIMQYHKAAAIGVDGEHRPIARTATVTRRPIQDVP